MKQLHDEANEDWLENLTGFLADCEASGAEEQAQRIAEAHALFVAAPERVRGQWRQLPPASALAAMCAAGACDSAALALIGEGMGFMLSRGGNGRYLTSVVLADAEHDHCSEGRTAALSILSALTLALLGNVPAERRQRPRDIQVPASRLN